MEIMTPQKKSAILVKKYNEILLKAFRMRIKVSTQKDFDKLRALALMSQAIDRDEIKQFMTDVFDEYYLVNKALVDMKDTVRDKTMDQGFSIWQQDIYDWWYMYCYAATMGWVYNQQYDYYPTTFENTTDTALRKLEKTLSNKSIEMIREESRQLTKEVAKHPPVVEHKGELLTLHVLFVWQSREDRKVCSICNELEGQTMLDIPERMPHLNCRCDFLVYEWWTDQKGDVVADRRYEIEQNKSSVGYGYSIRQAKVTSQLEGGEQVTIFEVLKDGTTRRQTYTKGGKK